MRPDIFTISVGALAAGSCVCVHITYVTTLKAESKSSRFLVPTFIAARYAPPGLSDEPWIPHIPACMQRHVGLDIQVDFKTRSNIKQIKSPTHPTMAVHFEARTGSARMQNIKLERDVVLLCEEEAPHQPRASVEVGAGGAITGLVTLFPHILFRDQPRELVFVIDRSGSMQPKMDQTRAALRLFVLALPPGTRFNIVGFGADFQPLFEESVLYGEESLAIALDHVETMQADMGGTNVLQPLAFVLSQPAVPGVQRQDRKSVV